MNNIINFSKGYGGRYKANKNGKYFEYKTRLDDKLINYNFTKKSIEKDYYFFKNYDYDNKNKDIYVFEQRSFNNFIKNNYKIKNDKLLRIYDLVVLIYNNIDNDMSIYVYEKNIKLLKVVLKQNYGHLLLLKEN